MQVFLRFYIQQKSNKEESISKLELTVVVSRVYKIFEPEKRPQNFA